MEPEVVKGLNVGQIGAMKVTQSFLIAAALVLQIPFVMIVLSQVLNYKANRWTNIVAAILVISVQLGTMGMGTSPSGVYIFYSIIEVIVNTLIIWMAWNWKMTKKQNESQ